MRLSSAVLTERKNHKLNLEKKERKRNEENYNLNTKMEPGCSLTREGDNH